MKLINKIKLLVIFALTLIASLCFVACENGGGSADVTIPDVEATLPEEANTYIDAYDETVVTLDGTITDAEWASQNKMDVVVPVASYDHRVEIWSRFTEDGVLMAYRVTGAPAYFVASRDKTNSGLEVYVANGNATTPNGNQWEIDVFASGFYKTACWLERNGKSGYAYANVYMDVAGRWLDKNGETTYVNNPENNGYEDEVFIPWTIFGGKCDSIVFNAAILYMSSAHETTRGGWVSLTSALEGSAYWLNCQQWRRFDKDGYYDKSSTEWGVTPYDVGYTPYNDGLAITGFDWNIKPGFQANKNTFTADKFVTSVKLYAPHLAHEEGSEMWNKLFAKETDTNTKDNGGTETATAGIRIDNNGNYMEVAIQKDYANGFKFRWNGGKWGWTQIKLSDKQVQQYMTVGLKVGLYVDGNAVIPLIENDDGSLERAGSNMTKVIEERDPSKPNTVRIYYQCDVKFDEYNVYIGDEIKNMFTVKDETSEDEHGSVTVNGKIFGDLVVNVNPEAGYELKKLTVNGVDYTGEVVNNVLTISNFEYNAATVKAIFREEITQSITLNVTQKFPYETAAYSADGVVITLADAAGESYSGKIANGAVTIKILDGTYTLTAGNDYSTSLAVVVENGVATVTDVILTRKIVKSYDKAVTVVESETGAQITASAKGNVALSGVDMTNALLIADLYGLAPNWADIGIEPYTWTALKEANSRLNGKTDTEGTGYRIDWYNWIADGTYMYQMGGGKHGNFYARTNSEYLTMALKTTAVDDTTSRTDIYVKNSFGTWYYHGYMASAVASHSELYYKFIFNGANNVKNAMIFDGARADAYFATLTMYVETETNSVTKDGVTLTRKNSQVDLSKFESEGTILSTGSYESQIDFSAANDEKVVAITFNIQIIDKTYTGKYDGNGVTIENNKWRGAEILHSYGGYIGYRFRGPSWSGYKFSDADLASLYAEGGLGMAYIIENGKGYLMFKNADGSYVTKLINEDAESVNITLMKFRVATKLTDVKVYSESAWNDASQGITQPITLDVTQKYPYETTAYSADGVEVTLNDGGIHSYKGIVANGKVTINVANGTYTLTAGNGYSTSVPVVVENGVASVTNIELTRKIVKSYDKAVTVVESETGAQITASAKGNVALSGVDMTNALLIADLYGLAPNWADIGIEPYTWTALKEANSRLNGKTDTEGTGYRIDWYNWIADGTYMYQMGGGKHGNFYARTDSEYLTMALKTTAVDDTTSKTDIYVKNSFGTWYYHGHMSASVSDHGALYHKIYFYGANNVKNLKIYDGARADAYFATLTMYVETEANSVTKDGVTLTRKNSQVDLSKFESEGTILSTGSYESQVDFSAAENVVAMTFNVQVIDKTWTGKYDGDGIIIENDQGKGPEILHSNNGYIGYRFRAPTWAGFRFTETELSSLYSEGGIGMAYVIKDSTEYLLLKGADGNYTQKLVNNVEATKITLIKFRTAAKFTNVKVYTASAYAAAPIEWAQA